ncbi:MAG: iron-sulfur cluster assembly scaffold protein [Thermomicrobiales bacterium]
MNEPYSAQVIEHFAHPRNLGRLPEANGRGVAGDLRAGDVQIEIAILVEGDRVAAARFRTFGCSAAIAASSVATTLIEGRAVAEAAALAPEAIVTALGGLPANKLYAPQLAADAVHRAVADWRARASGERTG